MRLKLIAAAARAAAVIVETASPRPVPRPGEPGFWKTTTFWTAALAAGFAAPALFSHFSGGM